MNLSLVTGPTLEPVTLGEAKAHCRISVPDDDALLAGYILAARQYVERQTERAIITQTFDLKLSSVFWNQGQGGWPVYWDGACYQTGIEVPKAPLQSVTSINYVDTAGASQLLASNQYQVTRTNGEGLNGLIVPAYGVVWPALRGMPDAVTVRFVAGYGGLEQVPHGLRQAMLFLIAHWYENREAVISGTIIADVPLAVDSLLHQFRTF